MKGWLRVASQREKGRTQSVRRGAAAARAAGMRYRSYVQRHSLVPFDYAFLPAHFIHGFHADSWRIGLFPTMTTSRSNPRFARFCPSCAKHDLKTLPFSYWRLLHQCPARTMCDVHNEPLLRTSSTSLQVCPHQALIGASQEAENAVCEASQKSPVRRFQEIVRGLLRRKRPSTVETATMRLRELIPEGNSQQKAAWLAEEVHSHFPEAWLARYFPTVAGVADQQSTRDLASVIDKRSSPLLTEVYALCLAAIFPTARATEAWLSRRIWPLDS